MEIARKAKASRAAVYAVLNGTVGTTIGVSVERRDRILAAAKEVGYVRNDLARSLATGRTYTIGVLVHSLKDHFFTDFFNHLDEICVGDGYSVFLANSEFDPDREARSLRAFLTKKVDGLVIAKDPRHRNEELLAQIHRAGILIVTLGELSGPRRKYPNATFDEGAGDRLAARHLWDLGHRRVLYFDGRKRGDSYSIIHRMRWEEFSRAWRALGGTGLREFQTADTTHGGVELVEHMSSLRPDQQPTAIGCSSDRLAISVISSLRLRGRRVPDEVSVMGFDDIEAAAECAVPLTTIRLPVAKLATGAWRLLKERLEGKNEANDVVIEPELVIRESTRRVNL